MSLLFSMTSLQTRKHCFVTGSILVGMMWFTINAV